MKTNKLKHLNSCSDEELILKSQKNDKDALGILLCRYEALIYKIINTYGWNGVMNIGVHEREDIYQIICIRVIKSIDTLRSPEKFIAWLKTVINNTIIDLIRRKKDSQNRSLDTYFDDEGMIFDVEDKSARVETLLERQEFEVQVVKNIKLLPIEFIEVAKMRFFDEMQYQEIADELDLPIGTAKSRIWRARTKLQTGLSLTI